MYMEGREPAPDVPKHNNWSKIFENEEGIVYPQAPEEME
jgi:hypothetical protein